MTRLDRLVNPAWARGYAWYRVRAPLRRWPAPGMKPDALIHPNHLDLGRVLVRLAADHRQRVQARRRKVRR